jgi:molybdopterin molybdotransferase
MTSVAAALEQLFGLLDPLGTETVPLARAAGRVLAAPALAERDQPPFAAALMDGYALNGVEADAEAMFRVIGTAAAGHGYPGKVGAGQCVRILTLGRDPAAGPFIRPAGADFSAGQGLEAPRCLSARDVGLLAAMNVPTVTVTRRPVVALIATGDELVMPGEDPGPDQIVASNPFALKPAVEAAGGVARLLPIGRDDEAALRMVFELAQDADLIVSFGGAALGDFDLVGTATAAMGMDQHFLKVDMQPGKRLMLGALNGTPVIGLPGNPVASLVCGQVFVLPALRALLGLGKAPAPRASAELTEPLGPNGARECYLPAIAGRHGLCPLGPDENGLFAVLSRMNALLVRPAGDGARAEGESVDYLPL